MSRYLRAVFSSMPGLIAALDNVESAAECDSNRRTCRSLTIATLLLGESCNQYRSLAGREFQLSLYKDLRSMRRAILFVAHGLRCCRGLLVGFNVLAELLDFIANPRDALAGLVNRDTTAFNQLSGQRADAVRSGHRSGL